MDNQEPNFVNLILTPDEIENLQKCGAVGFTPEQVALIFGWPIMRVADVFDRKLGTIYETYMQGRLQAELNIRSAVLQSAENGSTPSQQQIYEFYRVADEFLEP